jgi:ubiquinone/menaquinone biosynthesis C-methylase UbiE
MSGIIHWLDGKLYPAFQHRWDDQLFRERILHHLDQGGLAVLDLGAGAGIVAEMNFRGHARRVCGIDPDPRVADNPYLDEGRVGVGESIPYPDARFDVVFATTSWSICRTRRRCSRRWPACCARVGSSSARRPTSGITCR